LRVVLFGSGSPASVLAAQALADRVVGVVVPAGPRRARAVAPLERCAQALGVPVLRQAPGDAEGLAARLRGLAPDLLVVATYPYLLGPALLGLAGPGVLGLHPSLLPRHRGLEALLWTYLADDAQAGVSVFWLEAAADAGPVCLQEAVPLARGRRLADLYAELAQRGARLLRDAVGAVEAGLAARLPQDPTRVTHAPSPRGVILLDAASWSAERTWHVLRGACEGRAVELTPGGARLVVAEVGDYAEGAGGPPGSVERTPAGRRLWCRDGYVWFTAVPSWRVLAARLRRRVRLA
jgi:methionyl-tRNA formyltransferase